MNHQQLIDQTVTFVQATLKNAEGGHDWWHIYRVWQTAKSIAAGELARNPQQAPPNMLVVELAALLHDIADSKFHGGDDTIGSTTAANFLQQQNAPAAFIEPVIYIIQSISFKGGHNQPANRTPELDIVQDADRLDAIGAIGIARAFNYGGFKNRPFYDPSQPPNLKKTVDQYKFNNDPTINHFYEKLFLLKDRMNTATGRQMAEARHQFMEEFVDRFYEEWDGRS